MSFRSFKTFNRTLNDDEVIDFTNLPFKMQVEDVNSNFVQMYIFLDTKGLTIRQKELLPLLLDMWMDSPVMKNGTLIDIETVVKRRTKTLLHIGNSLGFSGIKYTSDIISILDLLTRVHFLSRRILRHCDGRGSVREEEDGGGR